MEPFIGQIQLFGFNFPPRGWAFCDGQILAISENEALFALIGTTYGGDGRTTFGLPDLRGRVGLHYGIGPGITTEIGLGQKLGNNYVTLTNTQLPTHNHQSMSQFNPQVNVSPLNSATNSSGDGTAAIASGGNYSIFTEEPNFDQYLPDSTVKIAGDVTVSNQGGNQPLNIMQPYVGIYHCIALMGVFPSRN